MAFYLNRCKLNNGEYLQWQYYNEYLTNPKSLLTNVEIDKINEDSYKKHRKQIICLNDKQIFNSIKEAESLKNVKGISNCCQGKSNFAGKDLATSEPLHWMYYEDYLKLNENNSKIN